MLKNCTVVIATHNRSAALAETLQRLYDLPEHPRLLVVDNASSDETERVWRPFGNRTTFVKLRRNLGAAARTVGAQLADTPYVAFCDDDCAWTPGSLPRAVERFERHSDVAVLNGHVLVGEGDTTDPACEAMVRESERPQAPGVPIVYFMAGACVMRTGAFLEAGGYNARYFIGAEESLLSLDLAARGWELWYCDDLFVRHRPCPLNRDPDARRRLVLRNRLWTALLRRRAASVFRAIGRCVLLAKRDRAARRALYEAIAALPWIVRERHPIPVELEARVRRLDNALTL